MKALKNLIALLALTGMATLFTGCGDDEDDDNNNNNNPGVQGPQFAPNDQATFVGSTYTVTVGNGQTAQLTFPTAGTYSLALQGGATETGQITGLNRQGEDWVGTITPANPAGNARAGELRAHFNGKNANSFTGTITYQGPNGPETFPFTATLNAGGTNAGGTNAGGTNAGGTNAGGTNAGGTTAGGTGLNGKTLQINYPGGGGEKFVFTSATAASYENGADTATYTYNETTGQLNIQRGGGQTYSLVLPAGSNAGTTTVTYQEPGGPATPDVVTFTLQ